MSPEILRVDSAHPDAALIAAAAHRLRRGELVAFPTETVYGLGADGLNAATVARIFEAKGRPAWNPVILHVVDATAAKELAADWSTDADRLAAAFWPGPLTLVLPKRDVVPDIATAGLPAVALRVPSHAVAQALLREFGGPIAAPSANRFTQVSPTTAQHVIASLADRIDCVLDGGPCAVGIESTVVDLSGAEPVLRRPGMIGLADMEKVLGRVIAVHNARVDSDTAGPQTSPGTAGRHYAPRADVWVFDAANIAEVEAAVAGRAATGAPIVALLMDATPSMPDPSSNCIMPKTPAGYAQALYAALHRADDEGAGLILIERPPRTAAWTAIHDRLARAAY